MPGYTRLVPTFREDIEIAFARRSGADVIGLIGQQAEGKLDSGVAKVVAAARQVGGEIDVVVFATGYRLDLPFLDRALLEAESGSPQLFLNMLHPQRDDVSVCGLIQPDSGPPTMPDRGMAMNQRAVILARR